MATDKLSRRSFLGGFTVIAAGMLIVACGSPTGAVTPAPTAPAAANATATHPPAAATAATSAVSNAGTAPSITLNWWPGWPGPYMAKIAQAFTAANPQIKVQPGLFYPEGEKLLSALAAQNAPDLVSDIPYYNFIERDLIVPIDDLVKASNRISFTDGDIRNANWDAFVWRGKHYGIPAVDTAGREAMGFNVNLIQEAGLDPNNLPQTWEEVFEWHQKLTKFDSAGNLQILGIDPLFNRPNATSYGDPWLWPQMWGFHYFDRENWKYDIDRPETVDFQTMILKFYDAVGVEKMTGLSNAMKNQNYGAFGAGRQAMAITYPSGPGRTYAMNPKHTYKWTWVPVPARRKGVTIQTAAGHAQVIMKGTKQAEAAFNLAVFMTEKQACDILFQEVGWVGPRKSWQKTMDLSKFPEHVQEGIKFFTSSLDEAKEVWVVDFDPEDSYLEDQWHRFNDQMNHHSSTPKDVATQLQAKMTSQLKSQLNEFKTGQ
jgi:maltose-binding protein MalE